MTDPTDLWFLAAQAWMRAALAPLDVQREQKLLERAWRAGMRARAADPVRAKRSLEMAMAPDCGELFDERRSG